MKNDLEKFSLTLVGDVRDIDVTLTDIVGPSCPIYTCIVYRTQTSSYRFVYNISHVSYYNTLDIEDVLSCIHEALTQVVVDSRKILCYRQPPLEIILEAAEPLIQNQAKLHESRWADLEFEDLCQMCRLGIVNLYRRGYYINAALIKRTFNNIVLQSLRHERDKPQFVNLDAKVSDDNENRLLDIIPDMQAIEKAQDEDEREETDERISWQKQAIIDIIGERQYAQLLFEYGNKATTAWSRKLVQTLKEKLKRGKL